MMAFNWVSFFRQPNLNRPVPRQKPEPQAPKIESCKPILVSLDLDRTLIPWTKERISYDKTAFLKYQHTLQDPALKQDTFVVLNTGRGLKSTRHLAPLLARVPFDAIALNDGQQLFIKPKLNAKFHPIEANSQWLRRLTSKQADPHWRKELKGWSTTAVLKDIRAVLPDLDFEEESIPRQPSHRFGTRNSYVFTKPASLWKDAEKDCWAISVVPDQAYLEIKRVGKKTTEAETRHYAKVMGRVLQYHLAEDWPNFDYKVYSTANRCLLHITPKKTDKAALVNYLANHRLTNQPKAIISAGDNVNDIPILSAHQLGEIPNYPILLGRDPKTKIALSNKPSHNLENVGWNQLNVGIEKQVRKIRPLLSPPAPPEISSPQRHRLNQFA